MATVGMAQRARLASLHPRRLVGALALSWPLAGILAVGAILRLDNFTQAFTDVFSWRQASTAMMAQNFTTNWNIFYPEVNWTGPGPSYQGREFQTVSYLTALLWRVFGQHDAIARVVVIAFGVWGIFALYHLVRRVWDEHHALAAAAMMALLPGAIFVDRSFLPDPAMVALTMTTCWMLVVYLQTGRARFLALATAIGSWAFLTKLPGLLVGLPMLYAAFAILGRRGVFAPRRLAALTGAAVVMLAPVVAYYFWARHLALTYPPHHFAGSGNWLWVDGVAEWWRANYFLADARVNFEYWLWTPAVMALAVLGLLFRAPGGRRTMPDDGDAVDRRGAPWFFHCWLAGCVFYYAIGARELVENPWNFHIFNPAVAAFAGRALILIGSFGRTAATARAGLARIAVVLAIVVVAGQGVLKTMYKPEHADQTFRLGLALRERTQPRDLVVTVANDLGDPVGIYYSRRRGWVFPPASEDIAWNELPARDEDSIRMLEQLRARGADWLGVVTEPEHDFWSGHPALLAHIRRTLVFSAKSADWVIYRIPSRKQRRSGTS